MSVPIYFSTLAKLLSKARYVNPQQMEEAIALFWQWNESVFQEFTAKGSRRTTQSSYQRASILIEILESLTESQIPPHLRSKGRLCPKCHGIGYKGRVGVYERPYRTYVFLLLINYSNGNKTSTP